MLEQSKIISNLEESVSRSEGLEVGMRDGNALPLAYFCKPDQPVSLNFAQEHRT